VKQAATVFVSCDLVGIDINTEVAGDNCNSLDLLTVYQCQQLTYYKPSYLRNTSIINYYMFSNILLFQKY